MNSSIKQYTIGILCLACVFMSAALGATPGESAARCALPSSTTAAGPAMRQGSSPISLHSKIVYAVGSHIYVMNADGSNQTDLTPTAPDVPALLPIWSPDGTKIAFTRNFQAYPFNYYEIYTMNADGSNLVNVSNHPAEDWGASWSPDSSKIMFTSHRGSNQEIYTVNADGTGLTLVGVGQQANWSPDGSKIAFLDNDHDARYKPAVMNIDGTGRRDLLITLRPDWPPSHSNALYAPVWSPDGSKIAFVSGGFDSAWLDIVDVGDLQGKNAKRYSLGFTAGYQGGPVWSPDGSEIAGVAQATLYVASADGKYKRDLVKNLNYRYGGDSALSWSPDGMSLAFYNSPNGGPGQFDIYSIGVDGSGLTNLSAPNGGQFPNWYQNRVPVCARETYPLPPSQVIDYIHGWSMNVEVSPNDGLVLRNVTLGTRPMAKKISVPYYYLETNLLPRTRVELKPDSTDMTARSRLVAYSVTSDDEKLVIEATYAISGIGTSIQTCMSITQRYEFYREHREGGLPCEPSHTIACSNYKSIVKYKFFGRGGDTLKSIHVAQRNHYSVGTFSQNTVSLFRDCDGFLDCVSSAGAVFKAKKNPLFNEHHARVITNGQNAGSWDNIHQTYRGEVIEPLSLVLLAQGIKAGCPECVHNHWRWGSSIAPTFSVPELFNNYQPYVPQGSKQDLSFAIVKYIAGEDDPIDYASLANHEPIRRMLTIAEQINPAFLDYSLTYPEEVVVWYAATGYQPQDSFFIHPGFFNQSQPNVANPVTRDSTAPASASLSSLSKVQQTPTLQSDPVSPDSPTSINFAYLYQSGATTFTDLDMSTIGSLPAGYAVYNNDGYKVKTKAVVSGPHTLEFTINSVSDQTVFNTLRVLHAETDPTDLSKIVWKDRTVLSPETPAPNFGGKTISARVSSYLGLFLITTFTPPPPPSTSVADLGVSISDSADPVTAGSNLTYTLTVTNNGPETATDVLLINGLSPNVEFVSATTSQGSCSEVDGVINCKFASIATGTSALVALVVNTEVSGADYPPEGITISHTAMVKASESDPVDANNSDSENTKVTPDANEPPTVSITSPLVGAQFVGPASITITATAGDNDGTIAKVDFFDNGELMDTGNSTGANQYTLTLNEPSFGTHILIAKATDNLGKVITSSPVSIIVNGLAEVSITSPLMGAGFIKPVSIAITASASYSGGSIYAVDFYADGLLIGPGTLSGADQYGFTWNNASSGNHSLTAVVTDTAGRTTTSSPVVVKVYPSSPVDMSPNMPPSVSLTTPTSGTLHTASTPITLTANATDGNGSINRVDFYANGALIGTGTGAGIDRYSFNWNTAAAGNHSLTARATDNQGAITTSSAVNITVNAPPSLSLTTPANNAQFTAPASIALKATASDSDGSVSKLDFYVNNYRIGAGSLTGANQYSFTWANVGIGGYAVKAVATDNRGATAQSNAVYVTVTSPALLVTASTTLNASDAYLKTRLEAFGYAVTIKAASSATSADANGKAVVVISSTVTPTSVGTKFRTVTAPVVLWESGLFFDMGMTAKTSSNFGTTTNQTQVLITNPAHPLAGGLSGTVSVVTAARTLSWGKPNANAATVATQVGDTTRAVIFGYEKGAVMPGLTAPGRRVGLFMQDDTAAGFNTNGVALFDAAIKWVSNLASLSGSLAVSPPGGSVDLSVQGSIDWAHWGQGGPIQFDHKNGITQQISNYTQLGTTSSVSWLADNPTTFSWTDGTPTVIATNTATGVFINGVAGNGFEITVPADTNLKTLKLYVGLWYAQGKVEATLTDGSVPIFTDSALSNNAGTSNGVYTIRFKAASAGQTLRVRYTLLTNHYAPYGNVTLQAATLQ